MVRRARGRDGRCLAVNQSGSSSSSSRPWRRGQFLREPRSCSSRRGARSRVPGRAAAAVERAGGSAAAQAQAQAGRSPLAPSASGLLPLVRELEGQARSHGNQRAPGRRVNSDGGGGQARQTRRAGGQQAGSRRRAVSAPEQAPPTGAHRHAAARTRRASGRGSAGPGIYGGLPAASGMCACSVVVACSAGICNHFCFASWRAPAHLRASQLCDIYSPSVPNRCGIVSPRAAARDTARSFGRRPVASAASPVPDHGVKIV